MRLFIDCEFNGHGGELMSMGIVSEDGREFYEVLPVPRDLHPWVALHVVPILGQASVDADEFKRSLHRFLRQFSEPEFVADWYVDLVHLFSLFAGRTHEESIAYPCTSRLLRGVKGYAPETPHNALSDAWALRNAVCDNSV